MKLSQKPYYTPAFCPLPWSGEETDRRRKQGGSGWSLHYSCSCNGPKLSPYGKLDHAASQSVKVAIIKTQTTAPHFIWQSEAGSLPVCSTHSFLCCIYTTRHTFLHLNMHFQTQNQMHTPFFSISNRCFSYIAISNSCPYLLFSPLFSTELLKHFPFSYHLLFQPERLICDWACCVFYHRLTASRGQRAAEMP